MLLLDDSEKRGLSVPYCSNSCWLSTLNSLLGCCCWISSTMVGQIDVVTQIPILIVLPKCQWQNSGLHSLRCLHHHCSTRPLAGKCLRTHDRQLHAVEPDRASRQSEISLQSCPSQWEVEIFLITLRPDSHR